MKPTDEMIKAAIEAYREGKYLDDEQVLASVTAIITAALAQVPGEPTVWIREGVLEELQKDELCSGIQTVLWLDEISHGKRHSKRIPLYTSPTPHLSVDREALLEEAREALKPFFASDWVDDNGWTELACQNDRIVDWFGPSDFRAVVSILSELEGSPNAK